MHKLVTMEELHTSWNSITFNSKCGQSLKGSFVPEGKLACPDFINMLIQTIPPVWDPAFSHFVIDEIKNGQDENLTVSICVNILKTGSLVYPLGFAATSFKDGNYFITLGTSK